MLIYKATCFNPSVGHLQACIEDDRLMGRNMKPYVLLIKVMLMYIINFIIHYSTIS